MKKTSFIIFTLLCCMTLLFWFSCNQQAEKADSFNLKVLDESGSSRLAISCPIDVIGSTWDGGGMTISADVGYTDGSQWEGIYPLFIVTNGTVKNVTLGAPCYDGIQLSGGNCTVENVTAPDAGTTFVRITKPGTYLAANCIAKNGEDKIFQINDLCTITTQNINVTNATRYMRQNGGKTWKMTSYCNDCTLMNLDYIFRSDSTSSIFYYRNLTTDCSVIGYPGTNVVQY